MNDRNIVGAVSLVGFLVFAFTPIIPLLLHNYGITNEYIVKASVGIATLICGYGVLWGFFKKENKLSQSKEGKIRVRIVFIFLGFVLICLAWFTGLPDWLADASGLSNTFSSDGETIYGDIGTRIFVSLITALGVIFLRFSIHREKQVVAKTNATPGEYERIIGEGKL